MPRISAIDEKSRGGWLNGREGRVAGFLLINPKQIKTGKGGE
jgi:hypothetical protein